MKFIHILGAAGLAASLPSDPVVGRNDTRAFNEIHNVHIQQGIVRNDLVNGNPGSCPTAIFIFARGTSEFLNMGVVVGPLVAKTLENKIANMADDATLWVQGVGVPYTASIIDSVSPLRTSQDAIDKAIELFNRANELCADTPILAAGYNQGTAVIARAIEDLDQSVIDQIAGVALFGYTLNRQNSGLIPGFPEERTQVYCRWFDLTCRGVLVPYSSLYLHEAHHEGPDFLAGQLP